MKKLVFILMILGLLTSAAHADTCGTSLMPSFTANQATQLCKVFGTAVNHSLIPSADNTYDLGSASLTWRTLYTGTSRIAKTSDILRVEQDANRLFTWDASSDTAFSMTFGDAGTTATQILAISASTADADDDSTIRIVGGGAFGSDGTRGATIVVPGEEVSSGADITYNAGASDVHTFQVAGTQSALIDSGGLKLAGAVTAYPADLTGITTTAPRFINAGIGNGGFIASVESANDASGTRIDLLKTRATDLSADVIIQSGDDFGVINFWGADGANYIAAAQIYAESAGTPGLATDMPSQLVFKTVPDGSATLTTALTLTSAQAATFAGAVTTTATGSLGWSYVTGADTPCTTTCTNAAVFGVNLAAGASSPVIVDASSATADACVCAGAS